MKFSAGLLSALVVLLGSPMASAGPIAEAGQRAEALQAEGKTLEALDALDEAVDAIWAESPLLFRDITLVESAGGADAERADRTYRPDETVRVRLEPVGYGYGEAGAGGGATVELRGDLAIENSTGQVLAEAEDFFQISLASDPDIRNVSVTFGFVVPYVRPGDYIARFAVRDENSEKTGSFDVPFTVAVPMAETGAPAADAAPASPATDEAGAAEPSQPPAPAGEAAQPAPAAADPAAESTATPPAQ